MKRILICLLLAIIMMSSCSPHSSQSDAPETNDTTTQSSAENEETTTEDNRICIGPPPVYDDWEIFASIEDVLAYFATNDFTGENYVGEMDIHDYPEYAEWAASIAEKGTIYVPCITDEFVYVVDVKEIEITADTYAVPVIDYHLDGVMNYFEIKTSYYTGDMPETAEEMLAFFKSNDFFEWHRKYEKQYTIAAEDLVLGDRTVPAVIFGGSFFEFVYEDMIVGIMLPNFADAEEVIAALSFEEIPLSAE